MMQPSANGIAALFQGNPGALKQRVDKEQQGKPGLPPDLKELMALQILTEKTDAAQRQAAMNQLNQAGGPNMPTVAQTLQERAKQALQARMMQAQQQQQAQQPQPQPIPTAPPPDQPEATPEMMQQLAAMQAQGTAGLDQLPSNVGENYAGGGIIAFAKGDEVPRPIGEEDPLSDEERARLERELEMRLIGARQSTAASEPQGIEAIIAQRAADLERKAGRQMSPEARELFTQREMNKFMAQQGLTKPQAAPPTVPPTGPQAAPIGGPSAPPAAPPRQAPAQQKPPVQEAPPQAPAGTLTPEQASQVKQVMLDRLNLNPYERERLAREEAEKFIGAPETASLQTLADELAAKRRRLAKEQEANQGFSEYMRQIALAPRGLTSAGAGTYGAEAQRNRGKALEAQDFETLKSMLETQAKISDVKRGWKKDLFTIGKAEFDKVYKDNYDAAKALGESNEKAQKLAQEAVLEREKFANAEKVARIYAGPQAASNARIEQAIQAMLKKPGNKDMTYDEAYLAVTSPTSHLAPGKQKLADLRAAADKLAILADPAKSPLDPEAQRQAAMDLVKITKTIAEMGGVEVGQSLSEADKALINKYLPKK